jgi:hypothetical protein
MTEGIFITGTDTGVGKTMVTCALLRKYAAAGLRAVGMKPVAAGGGEDNDARAALKLVGWIEQYGFRDGVSERERRCSRAAALRAVYRKHTVGLRGCARMDRDRSDRSEIQFFVSRRSMLRSRGFS